MEIINLKAEPYCHQKTNLICPHCGNDAKLSRKWRPDLQPNAFSEFSGYSEEQCGNCMEKFSFRYEADLYFTSFKKRGLFK